MIFCLSQRFWYVFFFKSLFFITINVIFFFTIARIKYGTKNMSFFYFLFCCFLFDKFFLLLCQKVLFNLLNFCQLRMVRNPNIFNITSPNENIADLFIDIQTFRYFVFGFMAQSQCPYKDECPLKRYLRSRN